MKNGRLGARFVLWEYRGSELVGERLVPFDQIDVGVSHIFGELGGIDRNPREIEGSELVGERLVPFDQVDIGVGHVFGELGGIH